MELGSQCCPDREHHREPRRDPRALDRCICGTSVHLDALGELGHSGQPGTAGGISAIRNRIGRISRVDGRPFSLALPGRRRHRPDRLGVRGEQEHSNRPRVGGSDGRSAFCGSPFCAAQAVDRPRRGYRSRIRGRQHLRRDQSFSIQRVDAQRADGTSASGFYQSRRPRRITNHAVARRDRWFQGPPAAWMWLAIAVTMVRAYRDERLSSASLAILSGLQVAYAIYLFFWFVDLNSTMLWILFAALIASRENPYGGVRPASERSRVPRSVQVAVAAFSTLLIAAALYSEAYTPLRANRALDGMEDSV